MASNGDYCAMAHGRGNNEPDVLLTIASEMDAEEYCQGIEWLTGKAWPGCTAHTEKADGEWCCVVRLEGGGTLRISGETQDRLRRNILSQSLTT
jgi:hypothetical protein